MTTAVDKPATESAEPTLEKPASGMSQFAHQCSKGLQKCLSLLGLVPFKVLLLVAVIGLALKINSETSSVVESFNVPAELEEKGYTGVELAHRLDDQMGVIRATVSDYEEELYMQTPGMRDALQLEMPGTGVSLNQITDLISHFIGVTPQRISGNLALDGEDMLLTVRISGHPSEMIRGEAAHPRRLVAQAAEHILKNLEPFLLGRYYVIQKRFQVALDLAHYLRTSKGRPTQEAVVTADLIEGLVWYEQQKYANALRFWNQALQRDPQNTNVLIFQGRALDALDRSGEAIGKYQKVIELEPDNVGVLNDWGVALYRLGRFKEAMVLFIRVTHLDPHYPQAYNNWGFTLFEAGEYTRGIDKIREAIRLDPKDAEFYVGLAEGMVYMDEYERAIRSLYTLLSRFPQHDGGCKVLVQTLLDYQQLVTIPAACSEVL